MKRNDDQQFGDELRSDEELCFDEELSKTLTAAVSARQESGFQSPEEFEAWLRQGEEKRSRRQLRRLQWGLTAAAVFACAVFLYNAFFASAAILPASVLMPWNPAPTYASPDSESDPSITEENGSIVIGGDGNVNTDTWTATFTSYDDIPEKYKDEIIWFEELPEDYEVSAIKIVQALEEISCETIFQNSQNESLIVKQIARQADEKNVIILNQHDRTLELNDKNIYIKNDSRSLLYIYIEGSNLLHIYDKNYLEQKKIEAMITSTRIGWSNP